MIRIQDIAAHLRISGTSLRHVGTAKDLGSAAPNTIAYPTAWVVLLGEQASENLYAQSDAELTQRVTLRFGVILAVRDVAPGMTHAEGISEIETVRDEVIRALGTHVPDGADRACWPVSGRLLGGVGQGGEMFFQDDFNVEFTRRV